MNLPAELAGAFVKRPVNANKYTVGTVSVVGGSGHYIHAPVIAGLGARAAGAGLVQESDGTEVWARPLADGSVAAGLFNPQPIAREIVFDLDAAGLTGSWKVRDAWRQRDEGTATRTYRAEVLPHATHVIRLTPQAGAGMKPGFKDVRDAAWWRLFRDRPEAQRPATAPLDCPECQIKLKGSK